MKNNTKVLLVITIFFTTVFHSKAQFTAGNLALFVAASPNATNTTGSIVEINKTSSGQSAITTNNVPSTTVTLSNQLRFNGKGQATGTCYLSNSNDFTLLSFTGANTIDNSTNTNNLTRRGVGTFNGSGSYNLNTIYTATGSARTATTINNINWYIAESSGFYTNGSSTPNPTTDTRSVKSFGGVVYGFNASSVFTISETASPIYASLSGITPPTLMLDFYLISSGSNGSNYDVLYIITASTIYKYSLVSGSWTANGTYNVPTGQSNQNWNLAAEPNGGGAYLYITAGDIVGTTLNPANKVFRYNDQAGYNATLNISNTITTLYTASSTAVVKGIAFVPNKKTLGSLNTSNTNHVVASHLLANNTTQPIFGFSISSEGIATLSGLTLKVSRAISNSDISNVKLWKSTTNDYSTSTLTNIGNIASPSGTSITFSGLSQTISNGNNYYFLTCDIASGVSGSTAAMQISLPNSGIIATGTNVTGGTITGINYSFLATNTWTGATSNSWDVASNWNSGIVPNGNSDITITSGYPILDINLSLQSGKTLLLSGTGTLTIEAGKSLSIASGGTADFGGKSVILKSSVNGSAAIGTIAGTLSNATNVTVERFISGQSNKGRWRFLSTPVSNATVANWMSHFYVTGPGDSVPANGVNGSTLGTLNTNGWHTNMANITFPSSTMATHPISVKTTSIRTYNEAIITGDVNSGWENVTSSAQALTPGKGFRAFIRGDKNAPNAANTQLGTGANTNIQGSVNLTLNGTVNQGEINANPTFSSSGTIANDGWNLLGNPYPCSYDLFAHINAPSNSAFFANISPTVYVYSAVSNGYISYNTAGSGTSGGLDNGIVPSGAAFFIKATALNPVFKFQEAYKTTNSHLTGGVHKTDTKTEEFGIKYYKDSTENDYVVIKMYAGATLNSDIYDIVKVRNENLNLAAYGADSVNLTASVIPPVVEETIIKLNVEATLVGTYHFDFTNIDNFEKDITVNLYDRFTNKTTDVRKNTKITFDMGAGVNQWGNNRFELILNKTTIGVEDLAQKIANTKLLVYPNPVTDVLNININNANFKNSEVVVYNISGAEVLKTNMANSDAQINIETLSNGLYFVKVLNQNGFNKTVKFVK